MERLLIALILQGLGTAGAVAAESCPVENATYQMMDFPVFSAGFRTVPKNSEWISDVAFYIHSDKFDRTFWFMFDQGSSAYIHLISTTDVTRLDWTPPPPEGGSRPLRDMEYFAADGSFRFSFEVPKKGDRVPTYVLVPALTSTMRYLAEPGESVPVAFFKLSGCDG